MQEFHLDIKHKVCAKYTNVYFLSRISTEIGEVFEEDDYLDLMVFNVQEQLEEYPNII